MDEPQRYALALELTGAELCELLNFIGQRVGDPTFPVLLSRPQFEVVVRAYRTALQAMCEGDGAEEFIEQGVAELRRNADHALRTFEDQHRAVTGLHPVAPRRPPKGGLIRGLIWLWRKERRTDA